MIVRHLYLQNYRVYEGVCELDLPEGLVGIYGPNGAGKSYLIEAIPWALYGYARGSNDEVRTTGVNDECIVEITFEHEGHTYVVRRTMSGGGKALKHDAVAQSEGLQVASGVREVARYMQQVLGMNEKGFLASAFAEQKQLAALSSQTPAERRKLVLDLLGITPIETAVKAARKDAKTADELLKQLQGVTADVVALRTAADDAATASIALQAEAIEADTAAQTATKHADEARARYDEMKAEVEKGRQLAERHRERVDAAQKLETEAAVLAFAQTELDTLGDTATTVNRARAAHDAVRVVANAQRRWSAAEVALRKLVEASGPDAELATDPPSDANAVAARRAAATAAEIAAGLAATATAAARVVARATAAVTKADSLDAEADCPTCGQPLGDTFGQVRAHRMADLHEASAAAEAANAEAAQATKAAGELANVAEAAETALRKAVAQWKELAAAREGQADARAALRHAEEVLAAARADADALGPGFADAAVEGAADALAAAEAAKQRADDLRGQLRRTETVHAELALAAAARDELAAELDARRAAAKAAGLTSSGLTTADERRAATAQIAVDTNERAKVASANAIRAEAHAASTLREAERAEAQHARIEPQAVEARLLGRLGELLGSFKDHEAASVGPRLAGHAMALFNEMTEGIYSRLELTENFEVRLTDANRTFDLKRFSGSEVDLANLALRIAISECVTLQSGGAVGLLVLDEVFGPLDPNRRARVLDALNNLQSRFTQVLVVTHADDVKAQLPRSIEVRVTGDRRATAVVS